MIAKTLQIAKIPVLANTRVNPCGWTNRPLSATHLATRLGMAL